MDISMPKAMAIAALSALVLAGIAWIESDHKKFMARASEPTQTPHRDFQLGEVVRLWKTGTIPLSVTTEVAATVQRLRLALDDEGVWELQRLRLVRFIQPNQRVRVIGFDANPEAARRLGSSRVWIQVRCIEGRDKGAAGWIAAGTMQ